MFSQCSIMLYCKSTQIKQYQESGSIYLTISFNNLVLNVPITTFVKNTVLVLSNGLLTGEFCRHFVKKMC